MSNQKIKIIKHYAYKDWTVTLQDGGDMDITQGESFIVCNSEDWDKINRAVRKLIGGS